MKIIPQTRERGRHAVQFLAENVSDAKALARAFSVFRKVPSVAPRLERTRDEAFTTLWIEAQDSIAPRPAFPARKQAPWPASRKSKKSSKSN